MIMIYGDVYKSLQGAQMMKKLEEILCTSLQA